jgi:hypothetical protein
MEKTPPAKASRRDSTNSGRNIWGAGGPEGRADGELARAGHRAREEEVREVGAGDEEHEPGETDQHADHLLPLLAEEAVVDGHGAPGTVDVCGGEIGGEAAAEAGNERLRLRTTDRGRASPDETDPGGVAVADFLVVEAKRPIDVVRIQVAPVAEADGQHADDLVAFAVDANRAADDVGSAPKRFCQ